MKREFIICASIHFDDGIKHEHQPKNIDTGFVICGRRHHNCYTTLQDVGVALGISDEIKVETLIKTNGRSAQGFMTSLDRHVSRQEAYKIAKDNNQIVYGLNAIDDEDSQLISENLY